MNYSLKKLFFKNEFDLKNLKQFFSTLLALQLRSLNLL